MLPTLPPHLLPGMLPVTQFNPFYNFPRMVPMITPPFLPVPPMFNMQMNLMKTMAMQAMTSRLQMNAPPRANFTKDVPMVPFPEEMRKVSSNQIKTIPSVGQPKLENQKDRKVNYMKKLSDAFMSSNIENRTILLEENENDEMPILIPIVPSSEATKTVSTNQIDTIPLTVRKYSLNRRQKKKNYIKKPLNAFMLFIKENRKTVLEENECDQLSAGEINKELGGRWKKLTDEERRKYFELAKIERELHKEKYPEWSAKDNYAKNTKKAEKQIHGEFQSVM
ncbi:hypothetical protein B9Z55_024684 [Caenorhabditis nigoni]|uniref:dTCF n=1 Tax=Caenorhabditis nigoni TaxID=1611254 RepID=A0A2G5SVJ2_9PELO|nr:hypothetical protein B9Z55_024684 [Caenorhabditis nigoni]